MNDLELGAGTYLVTATGYMKANGSWHYLWCTLWSGTTRISYTEVEAKAGSVHMSWAGTLPATSTLTMRCQTFDTDTTRYVAVYQTMITAILVDTLG